MAIARRKNTEWENEQAIEAQRWFESKKHVCPHCCEEVSNRVFLGEKSKHVDGRCWQSIRRQIHRLTAAA